MIRSTHHKKDGDGLFPCECGRRYRHTTSLVNHRRLECGKEPQFSCIFCGNRFYRKPQLRIHVANKHADCLQGDLLVEESISRQ